MANLNSQPFQLHSFSIQQHWIDNIGKAIIGGYTNVTENDAANAGGSYAYFEGVRQLREEFCPNNWLKERRNGIELVTSHEHKISICISSADENVGNPEIQPKTKNPKGMQFGIIVKQNIEQYSFWPEKNQKKIRSWPNSNLDFIISS